MEPPLRHPLPGRRWIDPRPAPIDLADDLVCGWTARITGRHRLTPDGCVDVLWHSAGRVVVCGPERHAWELTLPPGLYAVGVRFRPGAARRVLGVDIAELSDRRVRLEDLWGARSERVLDDKLGTATDPLAVLLAEARAWVSRAVAPSPDDEGLMALAVAQPQPSVATVAEALDLSVRQVQRRSTLLFGHPLSVLARIVRFQRFVLHAQARPGMPISQAAAHAGYFDHAHLVRDCRAITQMAPGPFLAGHDRTFPQTVMSDPYKTAALQPGTVRG